MHKPILPDGDWLTTENSDIHYRPVVQRCGQPFLALSTVLNEVTIWFYFCVALFTVAVKFKSHFPVGFVL